MLASMVSCLNWEVSRNVHSGQNQCVTLENDEKEREKIRSIKGQFMHRL